MQICTQAKKKKKKELVLKTEAKKPKPQVPTRNLKFI